MNRRFTAVLLAATMMFTMACGAVTNLVTGGGAGTVSSLWSDVPPLDGATKADLQLPLFAQVMIRAMAQGKMDFVAYSTTKTPDDIAKFYTSELMKANGWTEEAMKCTTQSGGDNNSQQVTICAYGKKIDGKDYVLGIVAAPDPETKKTSVFYVRVDTSGTAVPAK